MTASAIFGPIILASDLEAAVTATLQAWLPTYLAELERRTGREPGDLPNVRSWATVNRFDRFPEEQTPAAVVVSQGTTGEVERLGDGSINAWFRVGVAIVVTAKDRQSTNELAKLYAAVVRKIVLDRPSLPGDPDDAAAFSSDVKFVGEVYDDVPANYLPVGATGQVEFDVLVEGIVVAGRAPSTPTVDAPPDWPVVTDPTFPSIELEVPLG